ncbi:Eco29kI family restriction endonuclease [Pyxidicoccus sp. MSG2]|uniref:Eco29kI family restriction endonuclease n=1 Tax=Pyxidicoccus sp. MSG2 TaxID=2996790 RepID=UPI0022722736|nr:Eco29kI family restriction endonuclease [Pyxidicoccus sp. MSG2]MCY1016188.1 Eco29kI family restriction endonuclease [Pyxidicoccus sp. MSG2]
MDPTELKALARRLEEVLSTIPENALGELTRGTQTHLDQIDGVLTRIRDRLSPHAAAQEPPSFFDPADPRLFGSFAALALVGQDRHPMASFGRPKFYGSGIYAIYYIGDFEPYHLLSRTEHPIYVGKTDPAEPHAKSTREQGTSLWGRLTKHKSNIGLASTLRLEDFECRYLVVASGWQITAESALIGMFKPLWNKETKVVLGFGKHGDSADTRKNTRSPWDTLHPGRKWADNEATKNRFEKQVIEERIKKHFADSPPIRDADQVLRAFLRSVSNRTK